MHDVIIVGGGPVGSHVAARIATAGRRVLVLEGKPGVGNKACCTGIVSRECVTAFGIDDSVVLSTASSGRLISPSGRQIRLSRPEIQACILDRAAFDRSMAGRAQQAGAEYVFSSPVSDIAIDRDLARVRAGREGKQMVFEAKAVVIAGGFSRLGERAGLGRSADFALGAQTEVETAGVEDVEVYFGRKIAPDFFAWLVPISSRTARVGLLARHDPAAHLAGFMSSLQSCGKVVHASSEISTGGVPLKPLPRTCGDRLIAVGDAAGQVKPTTGGGIYYGLLCADIAAATLNEALQADDISSSRLAGYERAWRRKLGDELRIGYWGRKLFERLSDAQLDHAFETVTARGFDRALLETPDLSFDWHSKAIMRLMGYQAMSAVTGMVKLPFRGRRN